ncbi:spore coat U domain-containing protein [Pigmentiphaga sp.]|uniref:Csu type fimbrial protein n=1 Tax=Pigmentiphaga sp. TaxID=1977564 RepID=UPI0025D51F72|nr:spore coat U domain-containing protein [Pigmentiphaga sp.]
MHTRISLAAAGMLACLAAQPASAQSQSATATMYITARVVKSCAIDSVSGLAFGDIEGTAQTAQNETTPGSISFRCSSGTSWALTADSGGNPGSTRRMVSQTLATPEYLGYDLFSDPARTIGMSTPPGSGGPPNGQGTGAVQTVPIYGKILAGSKPTPDNYLDDVILTIHY